MDLHEEVLTGLKLLGDDKTFPKEIFSSFVKYVVIKLTDFEDESGEQIYFITFLSYISLLHH